MGSENVGFVVKIGLFSAAVPELQLVELDAIGIFEEDLSLSSICLNFGDSKKQ